MKLVEFSIDKNHYRIECPKKDEKKVTDMAKIIDEKAKMLKSHLRNVDDKTLLAILCLTIQDEAITNEKKSAVIASTAPTTSTSPTTSNYSEPEDSSLSEAITQEAINNINQITKKIVNLAKKIERS